MRTEKKRREEREREGGKDKGRRKGGMGGKEGVLAAIKGKAGYTATFPFIFLTLCESERGQEPLTDKKL